MKTLANDLNAFWGVYGAAILGYLTYLAGNYLKSKNRLTTLNHWIATGELIWDKLNEDERLGKFLGDKEKQFTILIQKLFPKMTDAQADLINKGKAGVINFGKAVVKEAEAPVAPVQYFDPLTGVKLAPGVKPVMPA